MNSSIIKHFREINDPREDNIRHKWKGFTSICMVRSERIIGNQSSVEERLYISSLESNAKKIGKAIRKLM